MLVKWVQNILLPPPKWCNILHKHLENRYIAVTVYPKKYAHGFCFAVLCCGYTLTEFPISIRLTSLALWQSNDCPSASKATLMNMDKYFMWIHYERLHNHNKAKHNKTVCIFLGIYCTLNIYMHHCHLYTSKMLRQHPACVMHRCWGKWRGHSKKYLMRIIAQVLNIFTESLPSEWLH